MGNIYIYIYIYIYLHQGMDDSECLTRSLVCTINVTCQRIAISRPLWAPYVLRYGCYFETVTYLLKQLSNEEIVDVSNPFEVTERTTFDVENIVDTNKYLTILFFSQHYTHLDTCPQLHKCALHYFARIPIQCIQYRFVLVVEVLTRGQATLDEIWTNMEEVCIMY